MTSSPFLISWTDPLPPLTTKFSKKEEKYKCLQSERFSGDACGNYLTRHNIICLIMNWEEKYMELAIAKEIQAIKKYRKIEESDILAEALRLGLKQLWRQAILDEYAEGKLSKKKAIKLLGPELVKRLDEEKRFIIKDVRWGLSDE
jgi:hypothetical protein